MSDTNWPLPQALEILHEDHRKAQKTTTSSEKPIKCAVPLHLITSDVSEAGSGY